MAGRNRHLSGIFIIVLIVLLAGAISTSLYFFKIKKNEEYQNQLHFRELREVGQSVDMAMSQLKSVGDNLQQTPMLVTIDRLIEINSKDSKSPSDDGSDEKITTPKDLLDEINQSIDKLTDEKLKKLFKSKISLQKRIATEIEKEDEAIDQLFTLERRMSGQIERIFETLLVKNEAVFEPAVEYCGDLDSGEYCDYLSGIYAYLVEESWLERSKLQDGKVIFELDPSIQLEWKTIEEKLFEKLKSTQSEPVDADEMEQNSAISNNPKLVTSQKLLLASVSQIWRRLINIFNGNTADEQCAPKEPSDYEFAFAEIDCISKGVLSITEFRQQLINEKNAIDIIESLEKQLELKNRDIHFHITQNGGLEDSTNGKPLASILNNFRKIEEMDSYDFYINESIDNREYISKTNNREFKQLITSLIAQLKNYKSAPSLVNRSHNQSHNLVDKARNGLLSLELLSSSEYELTETILQTFKSQTIPKLVSIKTHERIRLANGSDALKRLYFKVTENKTTNSNPNPPPPRPPGKGNKDEFTVSEKGEISRSIDRGVLIAPAADFLPNSQLTLFPLIMLVDNNGKLIATKKNLRKSAAPADLGFRTVNSLLKSENKNDSENVSKMPSHSLMLDREIGGVNYRIYLQPVSSFHSIQNDTQLYIVGLVPKASLSLAKLSIAPATAMWVLLALFVLTASIPLLKIRFVSTKKQFSTSDISQASFATLILLGLLGISASEHLFFNHFEDSKQLQATEIYKNIVNEFESETTAIIANRNGLDKKNDKCVEQLSVAHERRKTNLDVNFIKLNNCTNSDLALKSDEQEASKSKLPNAPNAKYLLEGVFQLDSQGMFLASQIDDNKADTLKLTNMHWLNSDLFISTDLLLDYRQYFKSALECNVWGDIFDETTNSKRCDKGWFFERINNVRDARKTVQFSFPSFTLQNTPQAQKSVLAISTRLRTFFHRVLPKDFGYAVFDDTGNVIFHSDDQRSLLENILVETDNNGQILSLLSHADAATEPVGFRSIYRNSEHQFVGGRLHSDVPLSLVVFYKQHPVALNNLLLLMLALGIYFGIVLPLFLACRFATNQTTWARLISYDADHRKNYKWYALMLFSGWLLTQFSMGVIQDLALRICLWLLVTVCLLWFLFARFSPRTNKNLVTHPLLPFAIAFIIFSTFVVVNWSAVSLKLELELPLFVFCFSILLFIYIFRATLRKTRQTTSESSQVITRISRGHACYLSMLIWLMAMSPASLIVHSVNGYLLDYQAHVQSEHLHKQNQLYEKELTDYLGLMKINEKDKDIQYQRTNWISEESLKDLLVFTTTEPGSSKNWIITKDNVEPHSDPLLNTLAGMDNVSKMLDAELHFLAKTDEHDKESILLNYDANNYMLSAIQSKWLHIIITLTILFTFTIYFVRHLVVQRLLGEHISENFRKLDFAKDEHRIAQAKELVSKSDPFYCQILRASESRIKALVSDILKRTLLNNNVVPIDQCLEHNEDSKSAAFTLLQKIEGLTLDNDASSPVLVLSGLDKLAFCKKQRILALQLLQQLVQKNTVSIVLSCEVAPLYRLCKPHAYPGVDDEQAASTEECLAWAELLAKFDKVYDWSPQAKPRMQDGASPSETLKHESKGWQEMSGIEEEFSNYHRNVRAPGEPFDADSINTHWTSAQIVEYFASHAGSLYRFKWQHCTIDERILLYQIASGAIVNPANLEVLEHLVKRGYLYRDVGWFLVNESFKRFILSAETEEFFKQCLQQADTGVWQYVRIPLMVGVLVLVAFIVFTTGQSIESVLTMFTAVLGLVPLLLRNISMFKGGE